MTFKVEQVKDLHAINIEPLVKESEVEGYRFLTRLVNDYQDGTNTFNKPGEALLSVRNEDGDVVAIGGVNQSPFPRIHKLLGCKGFMCWMRLGGKV